MAHGEVVPLTTYQHMIRVQRDTGGATDPESGEYTPGFTVLYEGPADVQDEGAFVSMRVLVPERIAGQGDGTVFLPEQADLSAMKPGDTVIVSWDGQVPIDADDEYWETQDAAEIVRVIRLGAKLIVKGIE